MKKIFCKNKIYSENEINKIATANGLAIEAWEVQVGQLVLAIDNILHICFHKDISSLAWEFLIC